MKRVTNKAEDLPTRTDDLLQDLARLLKSLSDIIEASGVSPPSDEAVWSVYAGMEKTVAILRLRLGVESPGVFNELPRAASPEALLLPALEKMGRGIRAIGEGELENGLDELRSSRNYLRGFLAEKRRARMREKRLASASRRSSSKPS